MTEQEALAKMIAPGTPRSGKVGSWGGVIQILVTSNCNLACFHCTQASQLQRPKEFMTPDQFEQALLSLKDYPGVVGTFGGNPALSPCFVDYCLLLRKHVPWERRGLWCNDPLTVEKGNAMAETYNPAVSNLNCHMSSEAYHRFKVYWPESRLFGLHEDSRHSPPFVAMRDVLKKTCQSCMGSGSEQAGDSSGTCWMCGGSGKVYDESKAWELISQCDINQHWSAGIGLFRGQLRAWFCEIAMAQAHIHQHEPSYPDTGLDPTATYHAEGRSDRAWWQLPMDCFAHQVRKHCHECGVPLRGFGELAQSKVGCEQVSATHAMNYSPKRRDRPVQLVDRVEQLGVGRLKDVTRYLQNAK